MEDIMPELNVLIGGENFAEIRRGKYCYIDKTGGMAAVIEVKRTKNADELPSLVEKGMKQITDNKYDALLRAIPSVRTILHGSIAFCKKSCMAKAVVTGELYRSFPKSLSAWLSGWRKIKKGVLLFIKNTKTP